MKEIKIQTQILKDIAQGKGRTWLYSKGVGVYGETFIAVGCDACLYLFKEEEFYIDEKKLIAADVRRLSPESVNRMIQYVRDADKHKLGALYMLDKKTKAYKVDESFYLNHKFIDLFDEPIPTFDKLPGCIGIFEGATLRGITVPIRNTSPM